MPDLLPLTLILVIVALTIILVVLSIQIFFILKEFRKNLKDLNRILVNSGYISDKINETVSSASLISSGAKIVTSLIDLIKKDESRERS